MRMQHWRNDSGTETLGPYYPPQIPYQLHWGAAVTLYNCIHEDTGYRLQPSPPDELWDIPPKHTATVSIVTIACAKFISIFPPHSNLHKLYRVVYRKNRGVMDILSKQQAKPARRDYPFGLGAEKLPLSGYITRKKTVDLSELFVNHITAERDVNVREAVRACNMA
jgi:hypothetical protein